MFNLKYKPIFSQKDIIVKVTYEQIFLKPKNCLNKPKLNYFVL